MTAASQPPASLPLVVDLDGTLCRSDSLHEALVRLALHKPMRFLRLVPVLAQGRAAFKQAVAAQGIAPADTLPYDETVLATIATARAEGRPVWLVSAADARQVEAVARHLGLFDGWQGTEVGGPNLKGAAKADWLVAKFGAKGFDYIGDSRADLPVWAAARTGLAVRPAAGVPTTGLTVLEPRQSPARALLRAMRPHQWLKNLLVLMPVLAALDLAALPAALLGMVCFCLAASGVYLINDLADLDADRHHPRKSRRPFASGAAPLLPGVALAGLLFPLALLIALLTLPPAFTLTLLVYVVATFLYSFWIKRKIMADVVGLAALYTLRVWAGAMATGIALSPWLLIFSMFLFFALAAMKRQAELEDLAQQGRLAASGRNLKVVDLPAIQGMSIAGGQAAVLVFALYAMDPDIRIQHIHPEILLLNCPVLLFWLGRLQILTRRGFMTDDPIVFAVRDRVSVLAAVVMVLVFILSGSVT
ncbi:UbiA family prenyltransferase [Gemmobacter serpentinus]|uniref:UbiA family prenyltransferase n=1 Tax=Gemmobacter serpentinus TaxID=2652247 RepID=UPI00124E3CFF|nr:UbiA family prenyltransferase [Gemmobacter serpentinus]